MEPTSRQFGKGAPKRETGGPTSRPIGTGAPKRENGPTASGPKPKRETGVKPPATPSAPNPKHDIGYDPYTKDLYSSNKPDKKAGPKMFPGSSPGGGADFSNNEPGRTGINAI
jgi:hypothetical protein